MTDPLPDFLSGLSGEARSALLPVFEQASDLSREEFLKAAGVAPSCQGALLRLLADLGRLLEVERRPVMRLLDLPEDGSGRLKRYHDAGWAVGHLTLLALGGGGEKGGEWISPAAASGLSSQALRAAWAYCTVESLQPSLEEVMRQPPDRLSLDTASLALAAIALRQPERREEIRALFQREEDNVFAIYLGSQGVLVDRLLDDPATFEKSHLEDGRRVYQALTEGLAAGSPFRFPREPAVPATLALTAGAAYDHIDFLPGGEAWVTMLACVPWLSQARAEDFYLPGELVTRMRMPWDAAATAFLLEPWLHAQRGNPGRNDPCFCNSGRKFKKCHGAN